MCAITYENVRARSLDEWMAHFGIGCAVRHQAAADAMAECELLRIWPRVAAECGSWRDVQRLAQDVPDGPLVAHHVVEEHEVRREDLVHVIRDAGYGPARTPAC